MDGWVSFGWRGLPLEGQDASLDTAVHLLGAFWCAALTKLGGGACTGRCTHWAPLLLNNRVSQVKV